jgi:hypothetical protein
MGELRVTRALERQQPDLGSVAVGDHQVVISGQRGQSLNGDEDVLLLNFGERYFTALQQGVSS